jgi:hypothetical protein
MPPDVEAQIDLLEVAVERDRQAEHRRPQEEESDDAHVGPPLPEIEFSVRGNVGSE